MRRLTRSLVLLALALFVVGTLAGPAAATPVCTDGYMGGPPAAVCGLRIFPEAAVARSYVQFLPDANGFREYQHGVEYLAQQYPRWISTFNLSDHYKTEAARSPWLDKIRAMNEGDSGDGLNIQVIKITDHEVPDEGKETLFFSLSVHGNERGGLEGGLRTAEDLAMAAENGGTISDGVANYESDTGREPEFHDLEVSEVLAKEAVYLVDFNSDGWAVGDLTRGTDTGLYSRGNSLGTDLNRQMPTVGRINHNRNPLEENEMRYGTQFMHEVAAQGVGGLMAYGADIHGELTSRAYIDIMYPAGEFDSVKHRQLMAIAERTKSVVDDTLYLGIQNQIEEAMGGNDAEGIEEFGFPVKNAVPTKPAHWATVWDTLGYTDTGFIGDYMATDLGVTGMDYEIAFNHTVPDKVWNVYLQENHINGSRAIIKTAMAYALYQAEEFNDGNVVVDPVGRAGYVHNPDTVTDSDEDGAGRLPGPYEDGFGANGEPVEQASYDVTNQKWFTDTARLMGDEPFLPLLPADIAADSATLDAVDTLVLADLTLPEDAQGRAVDAAAYFANLRAWVEGGGNLVLTDRAIHGLVDLGVVADGATQDISVYQPYANIVDREHEMAAGLRSNSRQLVEAAPLGYGIGNNASPMTIVATDAWEGAGGHIVATTGNNSGNSDDGTRVSVGEVAVGDGQIRIIGGALPTPTEENDHRYGLRNYAPTYSGLFLLENSIQHDAPGLGETPVPAEAYEVGAAVAGDTPTQQANLTALLVAGAVLAAIGVLQRRRNRLPALV
jgi:hypothetical protein